MRLRKMDRDVLACRASQHLFQGESVTPIDGGFFVIEYCDRCGSTRSRKIDRCGYIETSWSYTRTNKQWITDKRLVTRDGRAAMRAEEIRRRLATVS